MLKGIDHDDKNFKDSIENIEFEDHIKLNKSRQSLANFNDKKQDFEPEKNTFTNNAFEYHDQLVTEKTCKNVVENCMLSPSNEIEITDKKKNTSEKLNLDDIMSKGKSVQKIENSYKVHSVDGRIAVFNLSRSESEDDFKENKNSKTSKSNVKKNTLISTKEIKEIEEYNNDPKIIDLKEINRQQADLELKSKLSIYAIFCIAIAVLGSSFQVGWYIGVYNVPVRTIQRFFNQTYYERYGIYMNENTWTSLWSLLNALYPAGGAIGGFASGFIADFFGRKKALLMTNIFTCISGVLAVISKPIKSYETIIVGRFFSGLQSGLFSGIIGLYLSEIPYKEIRGRIGSLNHLTLSMGILSANILGLDETLGTDTLWPFLVGITLLPMIFHLLFLPICLETPKFLYINRNSPDKARKALRTLRRVGSSIENEISEIQSEKDAQSKEFLYSDFLKNKYLQKALITTLVIQAGHQLTGINAVDFYSTQIFISIGFDEKSWAKYGTALLNLVQVTFSVVSLVFIEKSGRRPLLITGFFGMALSSLGLTLSRIFNNDISWFRYLSILSMVTYTIFFSIGPGPIAWLITSELFKSDSRGKASSMAMLVNYFSNFAVALVFPYIEKGAGSYSFLVFFVLSTGFGVFSIFKVTETKNRTVEEIYKNFDK